MRRSNSVSLQLMAWVMALSPFMMAVLCHTGLRSQPLAIHVPPQPSLAFNQYAVDLRTIQPGSAVEAKYLFRNRGTEPVRITKIEPSCGCLTSKLHGARDNVIDEDGQGVLAIRMEPGNSAPGSKDYSIKVSYTDPEPREVELLLRMVIPATLWVTPPWRSVYHPKNTDPTDWDFTVVDGRGKRFEVIDVSIDTDLVEASIGETSRSAHGHFQQTIHVRVAANLPPGRKTYMLKVTTDDPDVPELSVPLMLEGEGEAESEASLDHQ